MYQYIYPWIVPDMFRLHLPQNQHACTTLEKAINADCDFQMGLDEKYKDIRICSHAVLRPEIEAQHTEADIEDEIWKAADKFCTYIRKRDVSVTFYGPNHCCDKKPWAIYSHFHVTVVADRRLGCDTLYNSMVALHRKKATCHIPASQTTRFPVSWANYLAQRPRVTWYSSPNDLIAEFTSWTMEQHIDRNVPLPANRKTLRRCPKHKYNQ